MAKRSPLPCPRVVPFPARCPGCGYDLTGTEKLGRCPECGTPTAAGSRCLAVVGVPRRMPGPLWRRLVWIAIGLVMATLSQTWLFIAFNRPWLLALLLLACIVAAAAMVLTGTPVSKCVEEVIFTPVGLTRSVLGKEETKLHIWTGTEDITTKHIGKVWQRLIITDAGTPLLDLGLRCDESKLDTLAACIRHYTKQTGPAPLETLTDAPANEPTPAGETPPQ